jgi:trans-aconitate 2-methyltransferase
LPEDAWQEYRRQIIPLLAESYPVRADGRTWFPFRRVFVVAQVT